MQLLEELLEGYKLNTKHAYFFVDIRGTRRPMEFVCWMKYLPYCLPTYPLRTQL